MTSHNSTSGAATTPREGGGYKKFENTERRREFCCGLCCIQGCIIGTVSLLYFFIVLPTGVLLVFHGVNHRYQPTTLIGSAVLIVPFVVVPTVWMSIKWCRYKRKERDRYQQERKRGTDNPYTEPLRSDEDDRDTTHIV